MGDKSKGWEIFDSKLDYRLVYRLDYNIKFKILPGNGLALN